MIRESKVANLLIILCNKLQSKNIALLLLLSVCLNYILLIGANNNYCRVEVKKCEKDEIQRFFLKCLELREGDEPS